LAKIFWPSQGYYCLPAAKKKRQTIWLRTKVPNDQTLNKIHVQTCDSSNERSIDVAQFLLAALVTRAVIAKSSSVSLSDAFEDLWLKLALSCDS
jgi:hypothetical protein